MTPSTVRSVKAYGRRKIKYLRARHAAERRQLQHTRSSGVSKKEAVPGSATQMATFMAQITEQAAALAMDATMTDDDHETVRQSVDDLQPLLGALAVC